MDRSYNLIATTAFGLEAVVRRELAELGYEGQVISPGRVRFRGGAQAICRANLWLRTADRVLLQQAVFPAADFEALFETTKSVAWDEWLGVDAAFPVTGRSLKSQLTSVPACQRAVKKAVVESLLAAHRTTTLPETGPEYKIDVAILNDQATLTIDTTGPSLHKRGYRLQSTGAPLKETMAAALVLLSFWKRERPLIDPFCGSGTIPIEAVLIARNLAPGLKRAFAAEAWPNIPADVWSEARREAQDLALPDVAERIMGGDIEEKALEAARGNAARAGVADSLHFQQRAFHELFSKRRYGCIITNPPYGLRLGDQRALEPLYQSIPGVLRRLPTWSHFILTSYPRFEALIQKQAHRRRKLYNGRIECTYYQFHGPKAPQPTDRDKDDRDEHVDPPPPHEPQDEVRMPTVRRADSEAVEPVFGGLNEKAHEQAELFRTRLLKRARHLRRWPTRQGVTCFRLYERDIPEIPLVVDRYEDYLHIAEYERPHDRDLGQHAAWLDLMAKAACAALGVERRRVFVKQRRRQRGAAQHERLGSQKCEITVNEGGLKFVVNLSDYVDTGLFLDHRITRSMVRDEAAGATFLNLFGYTGAFSVYAAAGGAAQTTTVDWSHSYLDWAQRNMQLNAFQGAQHRFVRSDARSFIRRSRVAETYDLAVVDPPTFSNSKRTDDDWDVQTHHAELLNELLPLMKPGGVVYFSSNSRRFKFAEGAIHAVDIRELSAKTVPADFRNRRIHRCWRIVRSAQPASCEDRS